MELKEKYAKLIDFASKSDIDNLVVAEQNNVLYISGMASPTVKDRLWSLYNEIDPDMRSGDLVMKIEEKPGGEEIYEIKSGDSLSKIALKYPGMTWQKIFDANKDTIKDPNKIFPGQKIRIPR